MQDDPLAELTGYACPTCGGALWKREAANGTHGDGKAQYQGRIGHAFTPAQAWIEHCATRNRVLGAAARALAENADLARTLAAEAKALNNGALAASLEAEAQSEERHVRTILEMLDEIGTNNSEANVEPDR